MVSALSSTLINRYMQSYSSSFSISSSSSMSSLWSDLPLDLLISIRNRLQLHQRSDLISFRSVCSQWRSAMPAPNPFPRYEVSFINNVNSNIINFIIDSNSSSHKISMPLWSSTFPLFFLCSSNGWLAFITRSNISHLNETLHLLDPMSSHKLIFPRLSTKLLCHYNKFKPIVRNASRLFLLKVVVSSSAGGGVAVAGIVGIGNLTESVLDRRFVFCRYGDGQRWSLLMERSKGIIDIALAGDGRFYAIGADWELFMLDERSPLIRLKKFKLWLPKKILEPDPDNDPTEKRVPITCFSMEGSEGSDLKVYGSCWRYRFGGSWICLKLDLAKLCCGSNNNIIDVACEAHWSYLDQSPLDYKQYFTPSLRELISLKVEEQNKG